MAADGLYTENVFPRMKVTWGTHTNQRFHVESTGCFRCHDDRTSRRRREARRRSGRTASSAAYAPGGGVSSVAEGVPLPERCAAAGRGAGRR